jgi:hypothetical protein
MDKETKFMDNLMESITKRRLNETKPQEIAAILRFKHPKESGIGYTKNNSGLLCLELPRNSELA